MAIYFTSDLHFGHKNIIEYDQRPFSSVLEMDEEIIRRWNNKIKPEDTVYILGDISWYKPEKTVELLSRLNGHKILIKGNHDKLNKEIRNCFEKVFDYCHEVVIDGIFFVLSHYPIHFYNRHHHGAVMLYGHVHNGIEENMVQEMREYMIKNDIPCIMYNIGTMLWNFEPVSYNDIRIMMIRDKYTKEKRC